MLRICEIKCHAYGLFFSAAILRGSFVDRHVLALYSTQVPVGSFRCHIAKCATLRRLPSNHISVCAAEMNRLSWRKTNLIYQFSTVYHWQFLFFFTKGKKDFDFFIVWNGGTQLQEKGGMKTVKDPGTLIAFVCQIKGFWGYLIIICTVKLQNYDILLFHVLFKAACM